MRLLEQQLKNAVKLKHKTSKVLYTTAKGPITRTNSDMLSVATQQKQNPLIDHKPGIGKSMAKASTSSLNSMMSLLSLFALRCLWKALSLPSSGVLFFRSIAILIPLQGSIVALNGCYSCCSKQLMAASYTLVGKLYQASPDMCRHRTTCILCY